MIDPKKQKELRPLLEIVRNGAQNASAQEAFASLLSRYSPLIESLVSKFSDGDSVYTSKDDLRQEATVVFYNSILTYDMEQNDVEFGLYAKICIYNALVSHMRMMKRSVAETLTDSPPESLFPHDDDDPSSKILEQEKIKALYSIIRKNLSDLEYRVWQMYMSGRTASEIAALISKDEKSVSNTIYRIRKKLRALLR